MRKVVYTCLVGKYDCLHQPLSIDEQYDYICFSNEIPEDSVGIWQIRKIPFKCKDKTRKSRYVKILPHMALQDYDYSLYIDANIQILGSELYKKIEETINHGSLIAQVNHVIPYWDCVYEEILCAYRARKVGFLPALKQFKHLQKKGMPRHYGLFENNIILRKHNDPFVVKLSEEWWHEYMDYSKRDQFSLMYIYWKNGYMPGLLFDEDKCARNVSFLSVKTHSEYSFDEKIQRGVHVSFIERIKDSIHWRTFGILSHFLNYNN